MKIVRERPCQNRHHEVNAPMNVFLPCGHEQRAEKWSLGGLKLDAYEGEPRNVGDKLPLVLELPFQGFDIKFDVNSIVVAVCSMKRTVEVEFEELSERAHDLMVHFLDDLIRGKMATVDDTICRIDVPVTPISTKPDPKPELEVGGKRWPVSTIVMSAIYGVLGVAVFGYLAILIYFNAMRIEVRSAVVSAPVATIKMPVDGIISPVRYERGMRVRAGETIARIESPNLNSKIEQKRIELLKAQRRERRIREKYRIEQNRMQLYQVISRTDRQISEARTLSARSALAAADAAFERLTKLFKKKLVTAEKLELATKERRLAEQRLRDAELELERNVAMDAASDRRYFNHKEFVTDLDLLALEVADAAEQVEIVGMQLAQLQNTKDTMAVTAPYDGKIVAVMQAGGTTVLRNSALFSIEQSSAMTVTAFVDQDEILRIGLNDSAKIYIPSLDVVATGTVTNVDRNSTFLNTERSHYAWKDGRQKSAAVSLSLEIPASAYANIGGGLPVVVIFPKRTLNDFYASVRQYLTPKTSTRSDALPI